MRTDRVCRPRPAPDPLAALAATLTPKLAVAIQRQMRLLRVNGSLFRPEEG